MSDLEEVYLPHHCNDIMTYRKDGRLCCYVCGFAWPDDANEGGIDMPTNQEIGVPTPLHLIAGYNQPPEAVHFMDDLEQAGFEEDFELTDAENEKHDSLREHRWVFVKGNHAVVVLISSLGNDEVRIKNARYDYKGMVYDIIAPSINNVLDIYAKIEGANI